MNSAVPIRRRLLLAAVACVAVPAQAAQVSVAVASNFAQPMQEIAAAFEQSSGHRVVLSLGSSGRFYAQVRNGAPFHLLLSADQEIPARLESEGLAVEGSRFTYARGRLALWSATPNRVDAQGKVLRSGDFRRLALASPRLAPYGTAAMQVIDRLGLSKQLQPRIVEGENIAQAHQFVATGNAELGFVAWSQVQSQGRIAAGSGWLVPAEMHAPIRQDAVLLRAARDQPQALALAVFLRGEAARAIIRRHGYELD
jgi:molybdate transport system substrate-binding protein